MQSPQSPSHAARLIRALVHLQGEETGNHGATLAHLCAGLRTSNGVAAQMMPFVAPFLPEQESQSDERYFQVAALYALHPQNANSGTFARACRLLADKGSDSIERRFQLLLGCESDQLFRHLQQWVGLLKSAGIPINWSRLLEDLVLEQWDDPERKLQLRWAREFYRQAVPPPSSPLTPHHEAATVSVQSNTQKVLDPE